MKILRLIIIVTIVLQGCVEKYDFVIKNKEPVLVVEGFISDFSYTETRDYPSDGRYFEVKLSQTSDVVNIRGNPETGATVSVLADNGDEWVYEEQEPGIYLIKENDFEVCDQMQYKLRVQTSDENIYESNWQSLPDGSDRMGDITFEEVDKYTYKYIASEKLVTNVSGIDVYIDIPKNNDEHERYFKWDFEPTWIFESPLLPAFPPVHRRCWVTNEYYMSDFVLDKDINGDRSKKLFFRETTGNERFIWGFSLLTRQFIIDEGYYQFLTEIKKQSDDGLFSAPPYNLETNLQSTSGENKVVGYFAVVKENAKRWYFNTRDLTYLITDDIKELCINPLSDKGQVCYDCLAYPKGDASLARPSWWEDH